MYNNNRILAVIPALSDLASIPGNNTRLLGDKPLIAHAIDTLKSSEYVDDIVVLTENSGISRISELFGVTSIRKSLNEDNTVNSEIFNAMLQREKASLDEYDIVLIVQPNAPLLTVDSINKIIEKFDNPNIDSVVSVKEEKYLRWGFDEQNNRFFPLFSQRIEAKDLPPEYVETDTILATRRNFISEESILGLNVDVFKLSDEESMVVNTVEDLWLAGRYFNKKRIIIVVNAFDEIGLGNVNRCLAIASKLIGHEVIFVSNKNYPLGLEAIKKHNYPSVSYNGADDVFNVIDELNPDIVINDILDTSFEYISKLKEKGYFVINFEDLGPGIEAADLVFNSLSDYGIDLPNVYTGFEYFILDDEFYFQSPKIVSENVNNVLLLFSGNDGSNITEKTLQSIINSNFTGNIDVLLGVGYPNKQDFIDKYEIYNNIVVYNQVRSLSEIISKADIVFTFANRTSYEVCSLGVPCICICKNERELINSFANDKHGFINMGLDVEITEEQIINQFISLVENYELRETMNREMLSVNLRDGFKNVWGIVKENYLKF